MGPRLLPILSAIQDTFAFFLLTILCLSASAHAYYNLQIRDEPGPTYAAVMQVVRLGIFGDFDLFEFEGLDPTYKMKDDANEWEPIDPNPGPDYIYVHVLFYMTGVGIAVLLMNVLIGVLSSNYERYEDQSVGQFYRTRVKMLVDIQSRANRRIAESFSLFQGAGRCSWLFFSLRGFCRIVLWLCDCLRVSCHLVLSILFIICLPCLLVVCLFSLLFFRRSGMRHTINCCLAWHSWPARFLTIFLVVREEPDVNEVRSFRTDLKRRIDAMEGKLEQQQQNLEGKLEKLEKHHQVLEDKNWESRHRNSEGFCANLWHDWGEDPDRPQCWWDSRAGPSSWNSYITGRGDCNSGSELRNLSRIGRGRLLSRFKKFDVSPLKMFFTRQEVSHPDRVTQGDKVNPCQKTKTARWKVWCDRHGMFVLWLLVMPGLENTKLRTQDLWSCVNVLHILHAGQCAWGLPNCMGAKDCPHTQTTELTIHKFLDVITTR